MYISMTPVAAAGATILGVELISSTSGGTGSHSAPVTGAIAFTGANSPLVTLAGFVLIAMALLAVAWTAKHPRR